MRHQAAIDLEQEIVGQPIGAIERLCLLQPGAALGGDALLGILHALTPAARVAQDAEPIEQTATAHLAAAKPARPERAAIASVAGEQLVAALAAEHDLHVPRRLLGEEIGRQHRVVGGRIVHRGGDRRQRGPEIVLGDFDLDVLGAGSAARPSSRARARRGRRCRESPR